MYVANVATQSHSSHHYRLCCSQTYAVLRQAHENKVATTLVINKIDKLCLELYLSPTEAYERIQKIIEQVNVTVSELYTADLMARDYKSAGTDDVASVPQKSDAPPKNDAPPQKKMPASHTRFSWLSPKPDGGVPATHTRFSWCARRARGRRQRPTGIAAASAAASSRGTGKRRVTGRNKARGKRPKAASTHASDQTLKFDEADEV